VKEEEKRQCLPRRGHIPVPTTPLPKGKDGVSIAIESLSPQPKMPSIALLAPCSGRNIIKE